MKLSIAERFFCAAMLLLVCFIGSPALAETYYWKSTVAEGAWGAAENWEKIENGQRVATTAAPGGDDEAIFESNATITSIPSSPTSVRHIHIAQDCELTFSHGKTLSAQLVDGEGTLVLTGNSDFMARSAASAIMTKVSIDGTAKMTGNADNLAVEGPLLGTGTLTLYHGPTNYKGVHLKGDNKDFQGTVIVDGNGNNRMKFAAATAGSSNAVFQVNGGTDNGSMTFSGGTIQFGEFKAPNGANIRCQTGPYTYEIGGKGTDFDMGSPDFFSASKVTVAKVGLGTMLFACKNYGTLELRDGVAERKSTAANTLPTTKMVFTGGTFAFGAGGAADISALITNSTAAIKLNLGATDVTFATALAASNSGGLEKSGSGTLTLTRVPLMTGGDWTVSQGALAVPAGATLGTLTIADGAELRITDAYSEEGTYDLLSFTGDAPSADTLERIRLTGLGGNSTCDTPYVEGGKVKVVVSAEALVWNGNGENWTATDKWLGKASQEAKTFAANDAVEFAVDAGAENTVIVDSAVNPSTVSVSAGEGGVQKFTGEGTLSASSWVNAGDVEYAAAGLSLDALTLTSGTLSLAGAAAAYSIPVPTGTGRLNVAAGASVTFDTGHSMSADGFELAGEGTLLLADGQTFKALDAKMSGFAGTIDVAAGAKLKGTKVNDKFYFGAAKIRLSGGQFEVGEVNAGTTNDIEFATGTSSVCNGDNANFAINGAITGGGAAYISTKERGTMLNGVNTNFYGELTMENTGNVTYLNLGFGHWYSGSPRAKWVLPMAKLSNRNSNANNSQYYRSYDLAIDASSNEKALRFGALSVPNDATVLRCAASPTHLVVGERETDDSTINSAFVDHALHLTKAGAGSTLTLGPAVEMPANSTIGVAAGELVVNSTNLVNATVTVASGATLSGTGTVASVTFEAGSKVRIPADADESLTYELVRTTGTISGKPEIVGPTPARGKWKIKTQSIMEDETPYNVLYAKFSRSSLIIVIK